MESTNWTKEDVLQVGTDMYTIMSYNIEDFRHLCVERLNEMLVKKKNLSKSMVQVNFSVDYPNMAELVIKDEINGTLVCEKSNFLDPLKGVFSIFFEPSLIYHEGKSINDLTNQNNE